MPPQEFAIATPRVEEMQRVAVIGAGAAVTGVVTGIVVKMAPQLGALEPILTWGAKLGLPVLGVAGALFTRGMISDAFMGVAAGGAGVVGYTLPEFLEPLGLTRMLGGSMQLGPGAGVKQLGAGSRVGANPSVRQLPADAGLIPILQDEGILV